jgi:hypothetical protein
MWTFGTLNYKYGIILNLKQMEKIKSNAIQQKILMQEREESIKLRNLTN